MTRFPSDSALRISEMQGELLNQITLRQNPKEKMVVAIVSFGYMKISNKQVKQKNKL